METLCRAVCLLEKIGGSNLAKIDATTDEEIARHMVEDGTPEITAVELTAEQEREAIRRLANRDPEFRLSYTARQLDDFIERLLKEKTPRQFPSGAP